MLPQLLVFLLWVPSLFGWGLATHHVFLRGCKSDIDASGSLNPGITMVLGLFPLTVLATLVHFFVPISIALAIAALVLGHIALLNWRRMAVVNLSVRSMAAAGLSMSAVALFASQPLTHFDTGLYHIQMAKWCSLYPLVRGLANLHERLGFNSLWTPLSALMDCPRFGDCACYPVTCLLLMGFGWAAGHALATELRSGDPAAVFLATCGCFWASTVVSNMTLVVLPSLSTDAPAYVMTLLSIYFLLRYTCRCQITDLFLAIIVSAMAVVFKITTAPVLGYVLAFGAIVFWRDQTPLPCKIRTWFPMLAGTAMLLTLWIVRSVFLSGYLIFPVPATALTFLSWHYPVSMGAEAARWIEAWARKPNTPPKEVLGNWQWLNGWFHEWTMENLFFTTSALAIFGALALLAMRFRKLGPNNLRAMWPAIGMALLGIAYWFVTAPSPRFGYAYVFGLAATVFSFGFTAILGRRIALMRIVIGAVIGITFAGANDISHLHLTELPRVGSTDGALRRTNQGLFFWVPAGDGCVMNGPEASMPDFHPSLVARVNAKRRIVQFELPPR